MRAELPHTAWIRGLCWTIRCVTGKHPALEADEDLKDRQYYGCCDRYGDYGPELTIYIRKGISPQLAWETLFHEVGHAIPFGFRPFDMKEEMPVEVFAGEIFSLCRQWGLL